MTKFSEFVMTNFFFRLTVHNVGFEQYVGKYG